MARLPTPSSIRQVLRIPPDGSRVAQLRCGLGRPRVVSEVMAPQGLSPRKAPSWLRPVLGCRQVWRGPPGPGRMTQQPDSTWQLKQECSGLWEPTPSPPPPGTGCISPLKAELWAPSEFQEALCKQQRGFASPSYRSSPSVFLPQNLEPH